MSRRNAREAKARRRMRALVAEGIVIAPDAEPPPAVMTCAGCDTADVNGDWLVITSHPLEVRPGDFGLCPVCVLGMFGERAFRDLRLLKRAQAAQSARRAS